LLEAVLTAPQKLFKIGLLATTAAATAGRALAPRAATAALPATAATTLIAPRHLKALLHWLLGG
jgi:hypothetical protein